MSEEKSIFYAQKLAKMIQCKTISFIGQTDKICFVEFQKLLKELFPNIFKVTQFEDFDHSFVLRWEGKTSERPILLMHHQDVVTVTDSWQHQPFGGEIVDGKLYGRGVLDDKGGLFCILQAADELAEKGFVPSRDIYFVSSCNEESSSDGANSISKAFEERNLKFDWVLDEGGMIMFEPIGGAKDCFAVVGVGEKGFTDLKFTATSKGGHSSTPPANSPLVRLGRFMAECEDSKIFDVELAPQVGQMFKSLSTSMKGPVKLLLGHPKFFKKLLEKVIPTVSPMAKAMVQTTLAFTRSEGSDANNVLPQEAWVIGNMRYSHHQGRENSIQRVKELADKYDIKTEILEPGFPSKLSSSDTDGFKLIKKAVATCVPGVKDTIPYIQTGATDSRYMSRVCDNCYRFVPFKINDQQLASIHSNDENVDVEVFNYAIDFYKYLMENF